MWLVLCFEKHNLSSMRYRSVINQAIRQFGVNFVISRCVSRAEPMQEERLAECDTANLLRVHTLVR